MVLLLTLKCIAMTNTRLINQKALPHPSSILNPYIRSLSLDRKKIKKNEKDPIEQSKGKRGLSV